MRQNFEAIDLDEEYLQKIVQREHRGTDLYIHTIITSPLSEDDFVNKMGLALKASPWIRRLMLGPGITPRDIRLLKKVLAKRENQISEILVVNLSFQSVKELIDFLESHDTTINTLSLMALEAEVIMALEPKGNGQRSYDLEINTLNTKATSALISILIKNNCLFETLTINGSLSIDSLKILSAAIAQKSWCLNVCLHYVTAQQVTTLIPSLENFGNPDKKLILSNPQPGAMRALLPCLYNPDSKLRQLVLKATDKEMVDQVAEVITSPQCCLESLYVYTAGPCALNKLAEALAKDTCCLDRFSFFGLDKGDCTSLITSGVIKKFFGDEYLNRFSTAIPRQDTVALLEGQQFEKFRKMIFPLEPSIEVPNFKLSINRFIDQEPNSTLITPSRVERRIQKFKKIVDKLNIESSTESENKFLQHLARYYLAELSAKCPITANAYSRSVTMLSAESPTRRVEIALKHYINAIFTKIPYGPDNPEQDAKKIFHHNFNVVIRLSQFIYQSPHASIVQDFWKQFDSNFKERLKVKLDNLRQYAQDHPQIGNIYLHYLSSNTQTVSSLFQSSSGDNETSRLELMGGPSGVK